MSLTTLVNALLGLAYLGSVLMLMWLIAWWAS